MRACVKSRAFSVAADEMVTAFTSRDFYETGPENDTRKLIIAWRRHRGRMRALRPVLFQQWRSI